MEALRTISTASISPANAVVVKVAFPEFGIIKSIRCVKSLPIGEIKSVFHSLCQFEDELYSIFIPAVDANGTLSFTNGKWCDDATLVSDCHLCPMHKLILARRVPESSVPVSTTTPTASPDTAKKKRLSRRILDFFTPDARLSPRQTARSYVDGHSIDTAAGSAAPATAATEDEQEFLKFAHSFAQRVNAAAAAENGAGVAAPAVVVPGTASTAAGDADAMVLRRRSASGTSALTRPRRMTFDASHLSSVTSMESEMNPVERRRQLVVFLSQFLETRVSYDELVSTGIVSDSPLPALCATPVRVDFVAELFRWVLKYGITEGIFRLSGFTKQVEDLTAMLNKVMFELSETLSPHLVASVLKKYLRDRPFATVPYRCYRSAMLIHESLTDKYAPFSAEECKNFVMNLPGEKQLLFITIARYLKKISTFEAETKMSLDNLSIVFTPVLMRARNDSLLCITESERQKNFLSRNIDLIVCP